MSKESNVLNLKTPAISTDKNKRLQLDSGRQIIVHSDEKEELIRIIEPEGEISLTVRMTDTGPVVTVSGAHLEIKSTETITLEAKKIILHSKEDTILESEGGLQIDAAKEMGIHSDDDIRIDAKIIHLN